MATRTVMRIELTPAAKDRLAELCKAKAMTQVAVASRLVEWFAMQPEMIQAAILQQYPEEIYDEVIELIVEHMAAGTGKRRGKKK